MNAVGHPNTRHPKEILYERVYDPLVKAWFGALSASPERRRLLNEIPEHDLIDNFVRFNTLFHQLMDDCVSASVGRGDLIETIGELREHVLWAGHMSPGVHANANELATSIGEKMKRNVSLGVIEALICLESAYRFCREQMGIHGPQLMRTLHLSRQLYTSLAVLHDEQDRVRLMFLTGIDGFLTYPEHDYASVLTGRLLVAADKFVVSGSGDDLHLRFVTSPVAGVPLVSPVLRCPAHRLRATEHLTMNDVLWHLLIDIYRRAGAFG